MEKKSGRKSKIVVWFLGFLFFSTLLSGCESGNGGLKAALGQEFTLPIGQSVSIEGESLTIKFEAVTADSRCPTGVQCVWAGEAKCQLQVTYKGETSTVIYTEKGLTEAQDLLNEFKVYFQLNPYPEAGKPIENSDYRLLMKVTR